MIVVNGLSASHRDHAVLENIDIAIKPGQLTVLIGPNASGKSTLLRCLAGIHRPDKGKILVDDQDVFRLSAQQLSRVIAYAPQENPQVFAYTVNELVGLGVTSGKKVQDALQMMDISHLEKRSLLTLSGGERQRAVIARVLAQDARYCLLDEPTAHLDPQHQKALFESLKTLVKEYQKGILVALHDLPLAAAYADTIILLQKGQVIAQGAPLETMTPDNLRKVYGIDAEIFPREEGKIRLSIF